MTTSLTTFDGFPRSDIDVAQIRTTRARIIRLKNDHKALMSKLEIAVQEAFAAGKAPEFAATSSAASRTPVVQTEIGAAASSSTTAIEPPFARVNTVVSNSPADIAGMQVADKVTKFGTVNWTNHERLSRVAQVVQQNENVRWRSVGRKTRCSEADHLQRTILVKVLREGPANAASQPLELHLTPRRDWGGRGLLGCHLLPV